MNSTSISFVNSNSSWIFFSNLFSCHTWHPDCIFPFLNYIQHTPVPHPQVDCSSVFLQKRAGQPGTWIWPTHYNKTTDKYASWSWTRQPSEGKGSQKQKYQSEIVPLSLLVARQKLQAKHPQLLTAPPCSSFTSGLQSVNSLCVLPCNWTWEYGLGYHFIQISLLNIPCTIILNQISLSRVLLYGTGDMIQWSYTFLFCENHKVSSLPAHKDFKKPFQT